MARAARTAPSPSRSAPVTSTTASAAKKISGMSIQPRLARRMIGTLRRSHEIPDLHSSFRVVSPPPPALMEAMGKFVENALKKGTLVDTGGLLPSKDGVRVRLAKGKITVTDGPFSESKEIIGGWAMLKTDSRAEAIEIATEFMELHRKHWPGFEGESEVRPMFDPGMGP